MHRQFYIFDLDGTLLNSYPEIERAFLETLETLSLPLPNRSVLATHIGTSMGQTLRCMFPERTPAQTTAFRAVFKRTYGGLYLESKPFPGAEVVMQRLKADVVVVTNKPRAWAEPIIQNMGWRPLALICPEDGWSRKPSPEMLLEGQRLLRAVHSTAEILSIGDTESDRIAASAAHIPFMGVAWAQRPVRSERVLESWYVLANRLE